MSEKPARDSYSLSDQEFLKQLGIAGMEHGQETLVRGQEEANAALARIQARAEGLQSLNLDQKTLEAIAREKGIDPEEVRNKYQFFRDLDDPIDDAFNDLF